MSAYTHQGDLSGKSLRINGRTVFAGNVDAPALHVGKYKVVGPRITAPPAAPVASGVIALPDGTAAGASNAANSIIAVLQAHGLIA